MRDAMKAMEEERERQERAHTGNRKVSCYIPNTLAWKVHDLAAEQGRTCDAFVKAALLFYMEENNTDVSEWQ